MSGDCGHGWGYHNDGPSGPCSKCETERLSRELAEAQALLLKAGEAFDEGADCIAGLRRELAEARGLLAKISARCECLAGKEVRDEIDASLAKDKDET